MKFHLTLCSLLVGASAAFAGAVDGPTKLAETVEEGKTDVYRISFAGGKKATVRLKMRGDVDLYIYDSNEVLVEKDAGDDKNLAKPPTCSWTPAQSAEFKIKVVNNETRAIEYKLETN